MKKYIDLLNRGESLIFPTETVYGIACDATNSKAVRHMYALKDRPMDQPTSIFVKDFETARKIGWFDDTAAAFGQKHWPGPLTLIVPLAGGEIAPEVTCSTNTIGIRIPDSDFILTLLREFGRPLSCTSANKKGEPAPTCRQEVTLTGAEIIPGACRFGKASTIIDCTQSPVKIIRDGSIKIG
ncbi:MAG: threonylcarbamoyl-AMP synthase [Lactobacillales bacterium]|jgi:L-threonylcarbamoyladenylate synthase|nr:threonylcarbamoyl-AMP synthase [Lactobacillales bacterium]